MKIQGQPLVRLGRFRRAASLVPGFHSARMLLERGPAIPSSPAAPVKTGPFAIRTTEVIKSY